MVKSWPNDALARRIAAQFRTCSGPARWQVLTLIALCFLYTVSVLETHVSSFGKQLKQEREQRGISLEDISQSTKISTRFLQALEGDHFNQLPGGIFNKGF